MSVKVAQQIILISFAQSVKNRDQSTLFTPSEEGDWIEVKVFAALFQQNIQEIEGLIVQYSLGRMFIS